MECAGVPAPKIAAYEYYCLVGLAEYFKNLNPPNIRLSIHCLQAALLTDSLTPEQETNLNLNIAILLMRHTVNFEEAKCYLDKAWCLVQNFPFYHDMRLQVVVAFAEFNKLQDRSAVGVDILRKSLDYSHQNSYWHIYMLFEITNILWDEKDFPSCLHYLEIGVNYSGQIQNAYLQTLFLLSKAMVLLCQSNFNEMSIIMNRSSQLIDNYVVNPNQKEALRVFLLTLQVYQSVLFGNAKACKPALKTLQQSMQVLTAYEEEYISENRAEHFHWMPKKYLCILVYLVTAMHSFQTGHIEKVIKYCEKAMGLIARQNEQGGSTRFLKRIELFLLEQTIQSRLLIGNKSIALQEIIRSATICKSDMTLMRSHLAQLHILTGLYASSTNSFEAAETQFCVALRHVTQPDLWNFLNLHLGFIYLKMRKQNELFAALQRVSPDTIRTSSLILKAFAHWLRGLNNFMGGLYQEARMDLRETMRLATAEDINRISACALVVLGHVTMYLSNFPESMNMLQPALELSMKMPDPEIQLWVVGLLRDIYRMMQQPHQEMQMAQTQSQVFQGLSNEHYQATAHPLHQLMITWTDGECPVGG